MTSQPYGGPYGPTLLRTNLHLLRTNVLLFHGNQTSPWNIAVVLSRKAFSPYKYAVSPWKHASSPWKHAAFLWKHRSFSAETRSIYVKHDAVARTGHLFSAETCSFSVETRAFSVETRAFSVDEHFPCELKKARPLNIYWFYTTGGGEEEKIKSQRNIVVKTLQANFINMNALIWAQISSMIVYSFCNNCGNRVDTRKYTY